MFFGRLRGGGVSRPISASTILAGHLVLHGEDVFETAVEAFRPKMVAADRIDELGIDAHPPGGASGAAFQDIAHAKIAGDRRTSTDLPL